MRELLEKMGFDKRKFHFSPAPEGKGSAKSWVRKQYPSQVKLLRRKNYQADLVLVAVRDGDEMGCEATKRDLDESLDEEGIPRRQSDEHIATPVPTWSIESWLLTLLGHDGIDESKGREKNGALETYKLKFERIYPKTAEKKALRNAAVAWSESVIAPVSLPSLLDGADEMRRLEL